ncbi:metalloregulator ArsR/SmtB family transcription factor [Patescibacteria group bacterium]|nr:metalloregulator ArsR/SmtB family transcription factor [Patescibacteria group bacterium]
MDHSTLAVISEINRFNIVEYLLGGPKPVGEISQKLHMTQPKTSKHLRVLADAGVVDVQIKAQQRIYSLSPQKFEEIDEWISQFKKLWEQRLDRLDKMFKKAPGPKGTNENKF